MEKDWYFVILEATLKQKESTGHDRVIFSG
jgi:hypothetical protein